MSDRMWSGDRGRTRQNIDGLELMIGEMSAVA
jgi:hypothetical protein